MLFRLAFPVVFAALPSCVVQPAPQSCVEADNLSSCACAPPDGTGYYLDPGYHYTATCSPSTLAPGTDVGCCALGGYPASDECMCRPNQPPGSCPLIGEDPGSPVPRSVSSCAIDGVLSSQ